MMPALHSALGWLSAPVSNAPLVLFRWMFGAALAVFAVLRFQKKVLFYGHPYLHVGFEATFRFLKPLRRTGMRVVYVIEVLAAMALCVGWLHPWAAALIFLTKTYTLLIESAEVNNHDYLICLLLFLYIVIDADHLQLVPYWQVLIIQLQVVLVYFFGGVAKINSDWLLRAMPFAQSLGGAKVKKGIPFLAPRRVPSARLAAWLTKGAHDPRLPFFFCWSGMAFDLVIGFALMTPKAVVFALVPFLAFHLFNHWYFGLGIFPWLNYASVALFTHPNAYRPELAQNATDSGAQVANAMGGGTWGVYFFVAYMAVQIIVPLRRYVFAYLLHPGKVYIHCQRSAHFSWTMKLISKVGYQFDIELFDRRTGAVIKKLDIFFLKDHVFMPSLIHTMRLASAALVMIKALDHVFVKEVPQGTDFGVHLRMVVAYNGRAPFRIVNPTVDLRSEKVRLFGTNRWQYFSPQEGEWSTNPLSSRPVSAKSGSSTS